MQILEPIQTTTLITTKITTTTKPTWTSELEDIISIEKELDLLINQHEQLSIDAIIDKFNTIKDNISHWIKQVNLTLFTLEEQLKDGIPVLNNHNNQLSLIMERMDSFMSNLMDMNEIINEKIDDDENETTVKMTFKMAIMKTQSEWSGLQHFILSVSKKIESVNEKRELLILMENILLEIDQLTLIIFKYQEKRQYDLTLSSSSNNNNNNLLNDNASTSSSIDTSKHDFNENTLMADIDKRVDPVFLLVEKLYGRMTSSRPPYDETGILVKNHRKVQEKWECLRIEIDELKDDLKEDRWLAVFKQVADSVDPMIDGLDKIVQQCYQTIHQIMDWHDLVRQQQHHHQQQQLSPHSPSTFDKITKTFLRSFPKSSSISSNTSTSTSSSASMLPIPPPPIDNDKFRAMEKNFEAKFKYYTPSIDRMLNMLGNGIASRVNKDTTTCKRHTTMVHRWQQLKTVMDDLRLHDMIEAERCLAIETTPLSPATSIQSDRSHYQQQQQHHHPGGMWKSIRRRTSEQDTNSEYSNNSISSNNTQNYRRKGSSIQYDDFRRVRSVTPSSGSYINRQRTTSPMSFSQHYHFNNNNNNNNNNMNMNNNNIIGNRYIRPSTSDNSSVESNSPKHRPFITGRKSLTPSTNRPAWNGSTKVDKSEFSSVEPLWKGESRAAAAYSPSSITSNDHLPSSSILSPPQNRKSSIPRPPSRQQQQQSSAKEASFMKPTKSTMLRKRSQSVEPQEMMRPKTPVKSSNNKNNHHHPGSLSPPTIVTSGGRRTKTPLSTSTQKPYQLPPRPRSSLARQETHDHHLPYIDREREEGSKSPFLGRRSNTPSLIPRPKTPNSVGKDILRATSPSLIPRPRSALRYYQQEDNIPPVPPLPTHLERPSIHLLKVGKLNKEDIYNDLDDLDDDDLDDDDDALLSSYATPGSFLSVPPIFDNSNNRSQSPSQDQFSLSTITTNTTNTTPTTANIDDQYYNSNFKNNNNNSYLNNNNNNNTNHYDMNHEQQLKIKKQQQQKRELLKKRSMPALAMKRSNSPSLMNNYPPHQNNNNNNNNHMSVTPSPLLSTNRRKKNRIGYFSEDEDDDSYHNNNDHELTRGVKIAFQEHPIYTGNPRDPLDMEVATILNSSPISIQCQKSPKGEGKYYFGNELNPTLGGGKKLYTCKLINYSDRPPRRQNSSTLSSSTTKHQTLVRNKVLVRVGGGWQDLEMFLLEHASLMTSDVVVRSFH